MNYEDIVKVDYIGKAENHIKLPDLMMAASKFSVKPSEDDKEKILLLAIDMQQDFMDTDRAALKVPGSLGDVQRLTKFIWNNFEKITRIAVSLDTHRAFQIFHTCWFIGKDGENPEPFTNIIEDDTASGKWTPTQMPVQTIDYLKGLGRTNIEESKKDPTYKKKILTSWPYHCILETQGHSLENQFANMIQVHSIARCTTIETLVKGTNPLSEMYGILEEEYSPHKQPNMKFLNFMEKFDKIIFVGEAGDFCAYESARQMYKYWSHNKGLLSKIFIIGDCMSGIVDKDMKKLYGPMLDGGINFIDSTMVF